SYHTRRPPRTAHSFPTRRSSDLPAPDSVAAGVDRAAASRQRLGAALSSASTAIPIRIGPDGKILVTARLLPPAGSGVTASSADRSEEHTSELQSHLNLVCRLLLE